MSVALESGERIAAAALVGADGVYSNVRKRILGDGEPQPAGAVIYRATIPAADMPKDLQHPYPTFWAGPGWHMIYYPISDWTMFNLGGTVVTGQSDAGRERGRVAATTCCRCFPEAARRRCACCASPSASAATSSCTASRSTTGAWDRRRCSATPRIRWCSTSRRAPPWRWRTRSASPARAHECDGDFAQAFQRYQDLRIVRTARVQISSLMMDRLNHAKGVERKVRNSLFEGRTPEEYYDRLAWLYTPPPYVK